jgi:hypothetical protein
MKLKSIDKLGLHVVARIVVVSPTGACQSLAAREMGYPSIFIGILNWVLCALPEHF